MDLSHADPRRQAEISFGEEELPAVLGSVEESFLDERLDGSLDWASSIDILKVVFFGKDVGLEGSPCSLHDLWVRSQSYYCSTVEYW